MSSELKIEQIYVIIINIRHETVNTVFVWTVIDWKIHSSTDMQRTIAFSSNNCIRSLFNSATWPFSHDNLISSCWWAHAWQSQKSHTLWLCSATSHHRCFVHISNISTKYPKGEPLILKGKQSERWCAETDGDKRVTLQWLMTSTVSSGSSSSTAARNYA